MRSYPRQFSLFLSPSLYLARAASLSLSLSLYAISPSPVLTLSSRSLLCALSPSSLAHPQINVLYTLSRVRTSARERERERDSTVCQSKRYARVSFPPPSKYLTVTLFDFLYGGSLVQKSPTKIFLNIFFFNIGPNIKVAGVLQ